MTATLPESPEQDAIWLVHDHPKCRVKIRFAEETVAEIHFTEKPGVGMLAKIKANGWRWSKSGQCWCHRYDPPAWEFARRIVAEYSVATGTIAQGRDTLDQTDPKGT